tara:strand:+ start:138 stop:677 length:540 start_codon:yes stop_codon:yes gene_type:complete
MTDNTQDTMRDGFEAINPNLDYSKAKDAWDREIYAQSHIQIAWAYYKTATATSKAEIDRLNANNAELREALKSCRRMADCNNDGVSYDITEQALSNTTTDYIPKLIAEAKQEEAKRLDFVLNNNAFLSLKMMDGTIKCTHQLMTQDADENYIVLSGEDAFFQTTREAIDAAIRNQGGIK